MRVNLFVVAAASLSMTVYAQSAIRVPDLGQREGINAADRRALRDPPPGSEVPKPDLLPLISPKNPQPGDSGAGSGSGSSPAAPAPKPNKCLEEGSACAEIIKGATELAQKLIKLLAKNAGTTTTSSNLATVITPRPLPDYYVIMATNMSDYLPLLNVDEQRMLSNNRSCFFANIQGYYNAAMRAAAARSFPVAASTTPTATPYLSRSSLPHPSLLLLTESTYSRLISPIQILLVLYALAPIKRLRRAPKRAAADRYDNMSGPQS